MPPVRRKTRPRSVHRLAVLAALFVALLLSSSASAAGTSRLLIEFRQGVGAAQAARILAAQDAKPLRTIPGIGVRVVSVPRAKARGVRAALRRSDAVRFAEADARARPQETVPNDPYFPEGPYSIQAGAWGWYSTHTTRAWDVTQGDAGVTIAILDTGLKPESLDFDGQLVDGHNVLDGTSDTSSNAGNHGTYVAGVAGLAIDSASGNAGYCPGCKIMPVQVGTDSGASYSDLATGIVWAADHGARVENLSWAGTRDSSALASAVSYARSKGAVVFAAAGNSNCDCPTYPTATPGVLGVAGVSNSGSKANDSNFGSWVEVAAPEGNMTAWPSINGAPGYGLAGGTSVASPAAAGIAGLLFSADPALSGAQVEQALESSATATSFPVAYGAVDAMAALEALGFSDPQTAGPPVNTIAPQVLVQTNGNQNTAPLAGAPQQGQVLVRGQGAWTGSAPLSLTSVRWHRCAADGSGCVRVASSWKYAVQPEDEGHVLKLTVTFSDPDGTSAASVSTSPVGEAPEEPPVEEPAAAPVNVEPPAISGEPLEGQALSASTGSWSNSPSSYAYQWLRCDSSGAGCAAVAGTTTSSYVTGAADVGSTLRVAVTAQNEGGSATASSGATPVVQAPAPDPVLPQTQTVTFSGALNRKAQSRAFELTVGAGMAHAELSFSKCRTLTLSVEPSGGPVLAAASGPSVLTLDRTLAAGTYTYTVSDSTHCPFALTVASPAP